MQSFITFEVPHFSLYKAVWSCVDHVLPETIKLRASDSILGFSFRTRFEARMTNCNNQKQFALCIQTYRGSSLETAKSNDQIRRQYPLQVGSCSAKSIKSGRIRIRYVFFKNLFLKDFFINMPSFDVVFFILPRLQTDNPWL